MTGRELMSKPTEQLGAHGFTLVEMMVTLVVVAVLLATVMPNLAAFGANSRLTAAAEQVYSHIELARSEAVARSVPVFLNFGDTGDAEWTYGMSVNSDCAVAEIIPTGTDACVMVIDDGDGNVDPGDGSVDGGDLVLSRSTGDEHTDVTLSIDNFSSGDTQIRFDPLRGMSDTGDILLVASSGRQLLVRVSPMGQARICSPDGSMAGYSTEDCS